MVITFSIQRLDVERKYTYNEIEEIRRYLTSIAYLPSGCYNSEERARRVEDELRTAILAGVEPWEIKMACEEAHRKSAEADARWAEIQAKQREKNAN